MNLLDQLRAKKIEMVRKKRDRAQSTSGKLLKAQDALSFLNFEIFKELGNQNGI